LLFRGIELGHGLAAQPHDGMIAEHHDITQTDKAKG
jgi:hypothetical protein